MAGWGAVLVGIALAAILVSALLPAPLNGGWRQWSLVVVRADDGALRVRPWDAGSSLPDEAVAVVRYEHFRLDRERWTLGRRGAIVSIATQPTAAAWSVGANAAWSACADWLAAHDPLLPDPVPGPGGVTVFAVVGGPGDRLLQQTHDALAFAPWAAVAGIALLAIALVRRLASSPYRRRGDRCDACGYALRGSDAAVCPECGAALLTRGERRLEG